MRPARIMAKIEKDRAHRPFPRKCRRRKSEGRLGRRHALRFGGCFCAIARTRRRRPLAGNKAGKRRRKNMKKFLSDFQTFISRGNVIDMAVGVIVGAAFTSIVTSLVKDVINPILGVVVGSQDFSNFFFVLSLPEGYAGPMTYDALTKAGAAVIGYGAFITAVFHFLLMAFVVFCLVRLVNRVRLAADSAIFKKAQAEKKAAPTPEEVILLREIRDLLKQNRDR